MPIFMRKTTALFVGLLLTSCHSRLQTQSAPKIINGSSAPAPLGWKGTFTAVVKVKTTLGNLCTGTFVRPDVLITAAHCTRNQNNVIGGSISVRGVTSSRTFVADGISNLHEPKENVIYDLAVIKFNQNLAGTLGITVFPKIQPSAPKVGDEVMIAGFGRTGQEGSSGTFRWGRNTLAKHTKSFLVITGTPSEPNGEDAVSDHGDSGGPMFNPSKEMVAITRSGSSEDDVHQSTYIWLGSEPSKALFKKAGLL